MKKILLIELIALLITGCRIKIESAPAPKRTLVINKEIANVDNVNFSHDSGLIWIEKGDNVIYLNMEAYIDAADDSKLFIVNATEETMTELRKIKIVK
jgi:hypothetical protein